MAGATIENFGNTTLLQLNRPVARGIRSTMRNQPRSQRSSLGKSCLCIRDRTNRPLWESSGAVCDDGTFGAGMPFTLAPLTTVKPVDRHDHRNRVGGNTVVVACEQPNRSRHLGVIEPGR